MLPPLWIMVCFIFKVVWIYTLRNGHYKIYRANHCLLSNGGHLDWGRTSHPVPIFLIRTALGWKYTYAMIGYIISGRAHQKIKCWEGHPSEYICLYATAKPLGQWHFFKGSSTHCLHRLSMPHSIPHVLENTQATCRKTKNPFSRS